MICIAKNREHREFDVRNQLPNLQNDTEMAVWTFAQGLCKQAVGIYAVSDISNADGQVPQSLIGRKDRTEFASASFSFLYSVYSRRSHET